MWNMKLLISSSMQKQRIVFLYIIALFSFFSLRVEAQQTTTVGDALNLQQCVDIALKNNLQVEQSELQKESNKVYLDQSKENLLPFIGASGTQGTGFGRSLNPYTYTYVNQQIITGSYAINTSLTLFSGLQLQNAIKQYRFAYDASKMDWQQQKDNITLQVLLAYLQVLSAQDLLAITREQADVDQKQVQRLELQNQAGALLLLQNLYDLKGQYAGDLVNIATSINNLETARIGLFQLLNVPYKRDVQLEKVSLDLLSTDYQKNSDSIYQVALQILPSIKSVDLKIKSNQKALQAARGQYYPTLSFYGSINTNYSNAATTEIPGTISDVQTTDYVVVGGTNYNVFTKEQSFTTQNLSFGDQFKNNRYTSIGLQLSVPILNSFRARNNVKLAKLNLKNAQYNGTSVRLQLQQIVEQDFQNMLASYNQYKSYVDQVNAFSESFRTAEIRFNEGVINSDTYVIAKNNIDRANANLIMAKYSYLLRTKILDYFQGTLTY
jgi:outer membrane protein